MIFKWKEKFREVFKRRLGDDEDVVEGNIKIRWVVGLD